MNMLLGKEGSGCTSVVGLNGRLLRVLFRTSVFAAVAAEELARVRGHLAYIGT